MALLQTPSALTVPAAFASAEAATTRPTSTLTTSFMSRGVGRISLSRQLRVQNGSRVSAWFKFGSNGADSKEAGIYGSQSRDEFDKDDVEQVLTLALLAHFRCRDEIPRVLDNWTAWYHVAVIV